MPDLEKTRKIHKAASHCFAHFGYAKTTMDDIGKIVGLNKASLYYYYKNKEAIFCEIIKKERTEFLGFLKTKIDSLDLWDEKILVYIHQRQRYLQNLTNLHKLSVKTTKELHFQPIFQNLLNEFNTREIQMLDEILAQAVETKQICPFDTMKAAKTILAMANGIKMQAIMQQMDDLTLTRVDYETIEEETRFATKLIINGLKYSADLK